MKNIEISFSPSGLTLPLINVHIKRLTDSCGSMPKIFMSSLGFITPAPPDSSTARIALRSEQVSSSVSLNVLEDGAIELERIGIRAVDDDANWWFSEQVGDIILMVREKE